MTTTIHAAARRLRGHLVATPLIGEIRGLGFPVSPAVRVKAECVQTAGTAHYRGCLHVLLRSLGRFKGLVLHGDTVLAQACAGAVHRLPMVAVVERAPDAALRVLDELGVEVERAGRAADRARELGFQLFPGVEDADVRDGIATLALELDAEMPAEIERVVVPDPTLVAAMSSGMAAAGRRCEVVAGTEGGDRTPAPEGWSQALAEGLRLMVDGASRAALWSHRGSTIPTCVVV